MKKVLVIAICLLLSISLIACSSQETPAASDDSSAASESPAASESAETSEAPAASEAADTADTSADTTSSDGQIKVGFAIRTMDGTYYKAIADDVQKNCEEQGWQCTVLSADNDIAKETENIQSLITMGMDLIFLDNVDPTAAVSNSALVEEAGIPLINLDSAVEEGAYQVTTVYSNNEDNGFNVGEYFAQVFDEEKGADTEIRAILISGNKGSIPGEQRREGLMAGIIYERTGCTVEEAWQAADVLGQEVIDNGKGENADAKLVIVGQGWGNWNENGGLEAVEDLLTANPDANVIMGENDPMLLGGMSALEKAQLTPGEDIYLISSADGSYAGYDAIKEGTYLAIGQNSPGKIAELGVQIAKEILEEGKDPTSYDEVTMTEAITVTKDNVDEQYEYGF